jgi:hypothetical protein
LLWLFFEDVASHKLFARVASNCYPPNLSLPSS